MFFCKLFSHPKDRQISVFVEGNIGAGKTSCIHLAKDLLSKKKLFVLTFVEDVDRWKNEHLLDDMYAAKSTRPGSRAFHVLGCLHQYIRRAKYQREKGEAFDFVVSERHASTTLEVFAADRCVTEMF